MKRISVLIVDDSALIRLLLTEILSSDKQIKVVGTAVDAFDAREKIKKLNPDVITLDIEMPKMDGITFLGNLMRLRPMPVIMVSSLTEKGGDITMQALELGAFDFVSKPKEDIVENFKTYAEEIIDKVKAAARSKVANFNDAFVAKIASPVGISKSKIKLIGIGASTGGTEAIKQLLMALPTGLPPIVIAQHIPDVFSTSYARRLDSMCDIDVIEVREKQPLLPGKAYLAPGDDHLIITNEEGRFVAVVEKTAPVNRHRPSVDVLFQSIAQSCPKNSVGILLTGMGVDGAKGLKDMLETGSITIAQDKETSIVWGMPGAAVALNAANKVLPLHKIAEGLLRILSS